MPALRASDSPSLPTSVVSPWPPQSRASTTTGPGTHRACSWVDRCARMNSPSSLTLTFVFIVTTLPTVAGVLNTCKHFACTGKQGSRAETRHVRRSEKSARAQVAHSGDLMRASSPSGSRMNRRPGFLGALDGPAAAPTMGVSAPHGAINKRGRAGGRKRRTPARSEITDLGLIGSEPPTAQPSRAHELELGCAEGPFRAVRDMHDDRRNWKRKSQDPLREADAVHPILPLWRFLPGNEVARKAGGEAGFSCLTGYSWP